MMTDYPRIQAGCLHREELWEDPDFPATQSSVFYHQTPPFQFDWKRPKDLCMNPTFIQHNCYFFDVSHGRMGDRWLISCLGVLFSSKSLLHRMVPADQDFYDSYTGMFRFRIYWCGSWTEVLVDDRLPTVNGVLAFVHCKSSSQFWPALLEKAYAKLLGSYEALKYGTVLDGLADMTGGITESIQLQGDTDREVHTIHQLLRTTSVITSPADFAPKEFEVGMNYRILAIEKVETKSENIPYVVKLSRPLNAGDKHPKLIDSVTWTQMSQQARERLTCERDSFWLWYADFKNFFTQLEVVHLDLEASQREPSLYFKHVWHMKMYQGQWRKGVSAGGCRNNIDFVHINPQIQTILEEHDTIIINLNQHSVMDPKVIGFSVYGLPNQLCDTATSNFFKLHKPIVNSQYTNSRQFSQRCALNAGTYLIVPTTFEPRDEAHFAIRVFSGRPLDMKVLDSAPHMACPAVVKAPGGSDVRSFAQYEQVFLQLADEHRTVNVFELQELLETCLPNDYVKSCTSLDTCRQIVLAMDSSGNGRITLNDFKDLICSLKHWQTVFKVHTLEKMGVLRVERLKDALRDIGFVVPEQAMTLIVLRYMRKDGTLRFGDFVSAVLHLQVIFKLFDSKDHGKSGTIKLNLEEWMKFALMS